MFRLNFLEACLLCYTCWAEEESHFFLNLIICPLTQILVVLSLYVWTILSPLHWRKTWPGYKRWVLQFLRSLFSHTGRTEIKNLFRRTDLESKLQQATVTERHYCVNSNNFQPAGHEWNLLNSGWDKPKKASFLLTLPQEPSLRIYTHQDRRVVWALVPDKGVDYKTELWIRALNREEIMNCFVQ